MKDQVYGTIFGEGKLLMSIHIFLKTFSLSFFFGFKRKTQEWVLFLSLYNCLVSTATLAINYPVIFLVQTSLQCVWEKKNHVKRDLGTDARKQTLLAFETSFFLTSMHFFFFFSIKKKSVYNLKKAHCII